MADHQNPPAAKTKAAGLLRPVEAAEYLAVSVRHLRDLSSDGKLPYVNVGLGEREARRYHVADLDEFIACAKRQTSRLQSLVRSPPPSPQALAIRARLDRLGEAIRTDAPSVGLGGRKRKGARQL